MRLKILLPVEILIDQEVDKVTAEAENGSFTILPRHIDFVASLVPGLLSFAAGDREVFLAVDEGVLVKAGQEVMVSVRDAVRGENLGQLERAVQERFRELDDREKKARSILAKFEADFIRRFLELERHG
ncbi:MAG: F0F1 ATP synthase subunit epsilon [Candidatus Aminicenantes bacterium]